MKLIGVMHDYEGHCDQCGEPIKADLLLVSDIQTADKYGNPVFFVLGETDFPGSVNGKRLTCPSCDCTVWYLRLYQSLNVTEAVADVEAHQ